MFKGWRDKTFVFFDLEAQNLNLYWKLNQPWQMALLKTKGKKVVDQKNIYIKYNPLLKVSKEAAEITRYDEQTVKTLGVDPMEAYEISQEWFHDCDFIVGHNVLAYDIYVYDSLCRYCGKNPYSKELASRLIDSKAIATGIKLGISFHPEEQSFLSYQYSLLHVIQKGLKTSILNLATEFNMKFDKNKLHDALYDISLNKDLFFDYLFPFIGEKDAI